MRIISAPARLGENWLSHVPPRRPPAPERRLPTEAELHDWVAAECFASRPPTFHAKLFSLEWFLELEARRYSRRSRWLPRLLEFSKHAGENVLGIGDGLGSDWIQYARYGARLTVCGESASLLNVVEDNFQLRGFSATFHRLDDTFVIPADDSTIDVACIRKFPANVELPEAAREISRVLKPGGKLVALVPARYNLAFWKRTLLWWRRCWEAQPSASEKQFSARELRRLFNGYDDACAHKRQLRRPEVPPAWRWLPLPLLSRIMGNVIVFKAFKPLVVQRVVELSAASAHPGL